MAVSFPSGGISAPTFSVLGRVIFLSTCLTVLEPWDMYPGIETWGYSQASGSGHEDVPPLGRSSELSKQTKHLQNLTLRTLLRNYLFVLFLDVSLELEKTLISSERTASFLPAFLSCVWLDSLCQSLSDIFSSRSLY